MSISTRSILRRTAAATKFVQLCKQSSLDKLLQLCLQSSKYAGFRELTDWSLYRSRGSAELERAVNNQRSSRQLKRVVKRPDLIARCVQQGAIGEQPHNNNSLKLCRERTKNESMI